MDHRGSRLAFLALSCLAATAADAQTRDRFAVEPRPLPMLASTPSSPPGSVPQGMQGHITSPGLQRVFLTIKDRAIATSPDSREVLDDVIAPILKAANSSVSVTDLRATSARGVTLPHARMKAAAALLLAEQAGNEPSLDPVSVAMAQTFAGSGPASAAVQQRLSVARGSSPQTFASDIERSQTVYPFAQTVAGEVVEHTLLLAARWAGRSVSSVRGRLIESPRVVSERRLGAVHSTRLAFARFSLPGHRFTDVIAPRTVPVQVLLPVAVRDGVTVLRHAWRMSVNVPDGSDRRRYLVWLDAENGDVLKSVPLVSEVAAGGSAWKRDPGLGIVASRSFEVDPASAGVFVLRYGGVATRLDLRGDGFGADEVLVSSTGRGSSAGFANFQQAALQDAAGAGCNPPKGFAQVHLFGVIQLYADHFRGLGMFQPYPYEPWEPQIEVGGGCGAWSSMRFGECAGSLPSRTQCPGDFLPAVADERDNWLSLVHDNTVVGHEVAHYTVDGLTVRRPQNWCGQATCPVPVGLHDLHGLADAWADHLTDTNCTGGWVAKNVGGVDAALNCVGLHREANDLPRLHQAPLPFDSTSPGDHFPEHRAVNTADNSEYADMQIAAAALWHVRQGVRSLDRSSGHLQYGARLVRAIRASGFIGGSPGRSDRGVYRLLQDLQWELIDQWATAITDDVAPGDPATSKVLAGFARVGLFAIPDRCIDGDATTSEPGCPGGEDGGDAVLDVDDDVVGDDPVLDGVRHPEHDYLQRNGTVPPVYHVWTGPRYVFAGDAIATGTSAAPCHRSFQVELSTDPSFPPATTTTSGWIDVSDDPAKDHACYGRWSPVEAWPVLAAGAENSRIYHRARTRRVAGGAERLSTLPAGGTWSVPPPYAVLTATGRPTP